MALRKQQFDDDNDDQSSQTGKRSRLTIDISEGLRRRVKMAAINKDVSISEYVGDILEQNVPEETSIMQPHRIPDDFLEKVYRVRERIIRESKGQLFDDSAELVRQQREERTRYLEELREQ